MCVCVCVCMHVRAGQKILVFVGTFFFLSHQEFFYFFFYNIWCDIALLLGLYYIYLSVYRHIFLSLSTHV